MKPSNINVRVSAPRRRPSKSKLILGMLITIAVSVAIRTAFAALAVWAILVGLSISLSFWHIISIGFGVAIIANMIGGGE